MPLHVRLIISLNSSWFGAGGDLFSSPTIHAHRFSIGFKSGDFAGWMYSVGTGQQHLELSTWQRLTWPFLLTFGTRMGVPL